MKQSQHSTVTTADSRARRILSTSYPLPSAPLSKKTCFTILFQRGKGKAHHPVWQLWPTAPYATQPHSFRLICKKPPSSHGYSSPHSFLSHWCSVCSKYHHSPRSEGAGTSTAVSNAAPALLCHALPQPRCLTAAPPSGAALGKSPALQEPRPRCTKKTTENETTTTDQNVMDSKLQHTAVKTTGNRIQLTFALLFLCGYFQG